MKRALHLPQLWVIQGAAGAESLESNTNTMCISGYSIFLKNLLWLSVFCTMWLGPVVWFT